MSRFIYIKIPRIKDKVKIKIFSDLIHCWANALCSCKGKISFNTQMLKTERDYQIVVVAHELGHRRAFKKNITTNQSIDGRLVWEEALADYYALQKCGIKRLNKMYDYDLISYKTIKHRKKEYAECVRETTNRCKLVLKWRYKKLTYTQAFNKCREFWPRR